MKHKITTANGLQLLVLYEMTDKNVNDKGWRNTEINIKM